MSYCYNLWLWSITATVPGFDLEYSLGSFYLSKIDFSSICGRYYGYDNDPDNLEWTQQRQRYWSIYSMTLMMLRTYGDKAVRTWQLLRMISLCSVVYNLYMSELPSLKLPKFPDKEKEKQRWEVWFQNCHRTSEPNKKTRIYSVHFESSRFKQTKKKTKRLTDSAVPTLFDLPDHLQKTSRPRATATSKRAAEPLSVQCVAVSADVGAAVSIIHLD
ncbi:hypothetical protein CAPTEDRAFT_212554 [Capitella teleta]|uniref:THAP-type domain-containing protein n=1 Tax=Capitella teleta TaxID=283909 RepID=R7UM69_CAPTE|nr:hypothetical protein CAPTEDRAFT_212554 [Capitella teleta]|eukprot:ELU04367.1 hypothetical protein CAPTEDRAFT_212554 [Capitella teleta]